MRFLTLSPSVYISPDDNDMPGACHRLGLDEEADEGESPSYMQLEWWFTYVCKNGESADVSAQELKAFPGNMECIRLHGRSGGMGGASIDQLWIFEIEGDLHETKDPWRMRGSLV